MVNRVSTDVDAQPDCVATQLFGTIVIECQ